MPTGESIDSNRLHVRRRIGSGAFGVVYEAFDPVRNQVVAVKALHRATPETLYRFKQEFCSLTNIAHRNLVRLYELIARGRPVACVDGAPLAARPSSPSLWPITMMAWPRSTRN